MTKNIETSLKQKGAYQFFIHSFFLFVKEEIFKIKKIRPFTYFSLNLNFSFNLMLIRGQSHDNQLKMYFFPNRINIFYT